MMNNKLYKFIMFSIMIMVILMMNIKKVNAETQNVSNSDIPPGGFAPTPNTPDSNNDKCKKIPSGYRVKSTSVNCSAQISSPGYKKRSSLRTLSGVITSDETPTIAGTALIADLYEQRTVEWKVIQTTTVVYEQTRPDCITYTEEICELELGHRNCYDETHNYCAPLKSFSCQSVSTGCSNSSQLKNAQIDGYNLAVQELAKYDETFFVVLDDPNNVNCPDGEDCNIYEVKAIPTISKISSNNIPNPVIKNYAYKLYGTCINVKTGKVKYLKEENQTCDEDEMSIESKYNTTDNSWIIFTPLNSKSSDKLQIKFNAKRKTETKDCLKYYETYKENYEYTNHIQPINGTFTKSIEDKKIIEIDKGCYETFVFETPITQKFYNEETTKDGEIKFKGFNFYYRQIDINNPFPNGIAEDSYWTELYDAVENVIKTNNGEKNENIKLSDSFDTITYEAKNIDLQQIREYNEELSANSIDKENPYTSWSNMNPDGTSNFVKNNLTLINKTKTFKLGCGPQNVNEYLDAKKTKKNPYYQEECDVS